jgi:branched-chain amino acid transport system ATP-binding protein
MCKPPYEQNLHFARQVADRAYIIEKGHIRFQGTMSEGVASNFAYGTTHLQLVPAW